MEINNTMQKRAMKKQAEKTRRSSMVDQHMLNDSANLGDYDPALYDSYEHGEAGCASPTRQRAHSLLDRAGDSGDWADTPGSSFSRGDLMSPVDSPSRSGHSNTAVGGCTS
jgi:hypothetical protein